MHIAIVESNPTATWEEIQAELARRTGIEVHAQAIERVLREAIVERRVGGSGVQVQIATETPSRYGYTQAHRRLEPEQTYPSCLTDAEWDLVKDLFGNEGGRGIPRKYARRLLVDACCYAVRTGCSWRMLPKGFPPWQRAQASRPPVSRVETGPIP